LIAYLLVEISTSIQTTDIVITAAITGVSHSTQSDDDVTVTAAVYSPQNDDNVISAAIIGVPVALSLIFVVVFAILICRKYMSRRG